MSGVAVIAHTRKQLDGGLPQLRQLLADGGVSDPLWFEVRKSKQAPARVKQALAAGADLVFVWGGDGMVQRAVDTMASTNATLAIVPAGTANLFATNLGIPKDVAEAVAVGLHGTRRRLDTGVVNGEHFAVMAGAGFDAAMIRDADRSLKDKAGRLAYIWTGARHIGRSGVKTRIKVDGEVWFDDSATCVLFGNVGKLFGGLSTFPDARPDDGRLELGVVTAEGVWQWARALARTAVGKPERSPFVEMTSGRKFSLRFEHPVAYELDGGERAKTKRLKVHIEPAALSVCVPDACGVESKAHTMSEASQ